MDIVLFDGECGLCRASIGWVSRRVAGPPISFVPRESPAGQFLSESLLPIHTADSVVFLEGAAAHVRSDAVLALLARCRMPWRLGVVFRFVPRPWRDAVYDAVARVRRRWPFRHGDCAIIHG
jgi:predicted DCC family thiol-disulfide oxidoreductase YuxK